jgi:xylan 1,4-beta-xylosidase
MGSPPKPSRRERAAIEKAGRLALLEPASEVEFANGKLESSFLLPRQGVSLLVFEFANGSAGR